MPFNPGRELEKLEEKVANSKAESIDDSETFQVRAAIRAKGWNPFFIEDAISRGFKRRAGKEVDESPWAEAAEQQADEEAAKLTVKANRSESQAFLEGGRPALQRASEVSRRETAEEDEESSGRVPPVRFNLLDKESQEQEKVREERPEKSVDDFWDCPNCTSVNKLEEDICPMCNLDRSWIEDKVLDLVDSVNTGLFTKEEHVRFLNDITILRRKNKRWLKFVSNYMEKSNLKPEDMAGLIGPKPWEEDMDAEVLTLQGGGSLEQSETRSDKELLGDLVVGHFEEKEKKLGSVKEHIKETLEASSATECPRCDTGMLIAGETTGSWACPECGWNIGYPEGESPSLKFLQDNKPEQEQRDPVPALDKRIKVIVSEEAGWLCMDCNRVWPDDFDDCATCKMARKAEEMPEAPENRLPTLGEYATAKKAFEEQLESKAQELDVPIETLDEEHAHVAGTEDDCELCKAETDLYKEVKEQEDMDFAEKAKLMLQLKAKEGKDEPVANEQGTEEETPV